MRLWKCCSQYVSKFVKLSSGHRTGKVVSIPIPKKGNAKECSNYRKTALISHASKVTFKILQAGLQQYMNCEFPDVKLDVEKAEEPEIKLPTSIGSSKKQGSSRKTSTSAIDYTKTFDSVDHKKTAVNSEIDGNTRLPDRPPEKSACRSESNS